MMRSLGVNGLPKEVSGDPHNPKGICYIPGAVCAGRLHPRQREVMLVAANLPNAGLTGSLPGLSQLEVSHLHDLRALILYNNAVSGTIPEYLGNLPNLEVLDLCHNNFHGTIPASLGRLEKLQELCLCHSRLSGTIPANLMEKMPALRKLFLQHNRLGGVLPRFAGVSSLVEVDISGNSLSGGLPSFAGLSTVTHLILDDNQINGELPPEMLRGLRSATHIALQNNAIHGGIPALWGVLGSPLKTLRLGGNDLDGEIPGSLTLLRELSTLELQDNHLTGVVPPALRGMDALKTFLLDGNELSISGETKETLRGMASLDNVTIGKVEAESGGGGGGAEGSSLLLTLRWLAPFLLWGYVGGASCRFPFRRGVGLGTLFSRAVAFLAGVVLLQSVQ